MRVSRTLFIVTTLATSLTLAYLPSNADKASAETFGVPDPSPTDQATLAPTDQPTTDPGVDASPTPALPSTDRAALRGAHGCANSVADTRRQRLTVPHFGAAWNARHHAAV